MDWQNEVSVPHLHGTTNPPKEGGAASNAGEGGGGKKKLCWLQSGLLPPQ
jgi:hypothetical protein